jgi:hypothetical protein
VKSATGSGDARYVNISNVIVTESVDGRAGALVIQSYNDGFSTKYINVNNAVMHGAGIAVQQTDGETQFVSLNNVAVFSASGNSFYVDSGAGIILSNCRSQYAKYYGFYAVGATNVDLVGCFSNGDSSGASFGTFGMKQLDGNYNNAYGTNFSATDFFGLYNDIKMLDYAGTGWATFVQRDTSTSGVYISLDSIRYINPWRSLLEIQGALHVSGKYYLRNDINALDKAGTGWVSFVQWDTSDAESRLYLDNIGKVTFSGPAGTGIYVSRDVSGNLVFSDSAGGTEYTLAQLAGTAPMGDSAAFIYKVTGGAYVGDTLEISPTGYISIGRSGKVVTFTPDTSAGKLATQTMNNLKLAKTDTASLSSRINLKLTATDTASLSSRINLKLNSSAAFIGGYTVSRVDSMKLATGTGISMSQSGGNITITATELRKVPAYGVATNTFLRNDSTWAVPPGADGIDTAAVMGLISDSTVLIATASGYSTKDSSGVIVNGPYSVPQVLLASITLDSSCQFLTDTTQIGYVQYKSVIDTIVLYSNSTVSLTPRFLNVSTPIITSPAAFTTARTATRLSSFNAPNVAARSMLHVLFDAITTKGTKFSVQVYGHYVP